MLEQACSEALVSKYTSQACGAAMHLGVAMWGEVVEVADQIAVMVGMKVLERRRFLEQVRSMN